MTNKEKQLALKSAERNVEHSINTFTIAGTIIYKSTLKDQVKTNREGKYILYVKVRTDFSDKKFHDIPLRLLDRQAIMVYDNFEIGDYIAIQGSIKYFSETGKLFIRYTYETICCMDAFQNIMIKGEH